MDHGTELLTARKLAKRLRVSPETVRAWARRGRIPTLHLSRKSIRFDAFAVLAALSQACDKGVARG